MKQHTATNTKLSDDNFQLLRTVGRMIHTQDGQTLFQEGERQDNIFVLLEGKMKVGKRAHKPTWMDMGAYGMIDVEEDKPGWERARVYSDTVCLALPDCGRPDCHELAAVSEGECELLMVNVHTLQKALQQQPARGERLLGNLRRLMV